VFYAHREEMMREDATRETTGSDASWSRFRIEEEARKMASSAFLNTL